jgi:hypothetical protein
MAIEAREREAARERPRNPELKVEPPEYYEGEASEIDSWLRRMSYLLQHGTDSYIMQT